MWRSQAAALTLFDQALQEAAESLDAHRQISMEAFWRIVTQVLRLKPLRLHDGRRNVVHVLSAPEARQWTAPIVFVPGLVEKQFPQFHGQDPFFPDGARTRLHAAGIRIRTAAEMEREERALFDSAISRASMLTTLSYPESDARGGAQSALRVPGRLDPGGAAGAPGEAASTRSASAYRRAARRVVAAIAGVARAQERARFADRARSVHAVPVSIFRQSSDAPEDRTAASRRAAGLPYARQHRA